MARRIQLVIDVEVVNEQLLRKTARDWYARANGGNDLYANHDRKLSTAVLEAVVLSNLNPSPDLYGIQFIEWSAEEL